MTDLGGMADALAQEFMSDVADRFFGDRKRLDETMELFYCRVEQLKEIARTVRARVGLLDYVLLRGELAPDFWQAIDVEHMPFAGYHTRPGVLPEDRPWALTRKRRWKKWIMKSYRLLEQSVHDYMHGQVYDHPRIKGKKMVTLHYDQLKALHTRIVEEAERINKEMSPSEMLSYTKGFSPEQCSKEKVAGVLPDGYACSLDSEFAYMTVDFDSLLLPEYPDLPSPAQIEGVVTRLVDRVWRERSADVIELLDEMKHIPDGCLLDGEETENRHCPEESHNA